jgi:hypothetical protein
VQNPWMVSRASIGERHTMDFQLKDYFFSAAERGQNNADIKCKCFHRQLEVILKSFYAAQEPGALHDVPVQLGNVVQRVNLYVPLQFIIGDVEGGDQLCSCQTFRREICLRMCRTCDVVYVLLILNMH